MLLTGSFQEYPLNLLLEIFLRRRETGLLEISSPQQTGYFYFKNGQIKDGEIGSVKGAAAFELATTFADATFQFTPLKPTDYAQVVWEKNFGSKRVVADAPATRVTVSETTFKQLRPYTEAAFSTFARAGVSLVHRAVRLALPFLSVAYHRLHKSAGFVSRRISSYCRLVYDFSKRAQFGRRLSTLLRKLPAALLIALRWSAAAIRERAHTVSLQRTMTRPRKRAVWPSWRQVAESNISFALILLTIVVIGVVSISKILRMDQNDFNLAGPADEDAGTQIQPSKQVSKPRQKQSPRTGKPTPQVRKKGINRIARQRRYPKAEQHPQIVEVRVSQPQQ